ncbi:MAG: sugar transferase [Reyranella sp.]|uniref:sugar transferase n=1 Tax=Reyranella sp. TaxID=1929291 RepID=UPI001AD3ADB2|nr:sugar transferase [Reyranella sp.]MBN9088909.1 sugar transferase [Reyranella sp.]
MAKRAFDLAMILATAMPILAVCLVVAILVKATSPGPVLYWSDRVGAHSRIFRMPKFRTMRTDTPVVATHLLQNPAQWITPIGAFLRSSSLDELPQLLSVLRGDMSLVGPRPALYNQADLVAARRECGVDALQPGITGWAQINGRDELPIPEKVAYDHEYLKRQSFVFDLRIILLTVVNVLQRKGVSH